jgi:hypothetical protein
MSERMIDEILDIGGKMYKLRVLAHEALIKYDRLFDEAESIRIERDKLRAENAELRKLIEKSFGYAYASGITHKSENRGLAGPAVLNAWDEWSAQHPILSKEQP